jgi:Mg-chelatase subunit ChlD
MMRFLYRKRARRVRRVVLALLFLSMVVPLNALWAQSSVGPIASPSAALTRTADEVNEAGYSLKPTGLATNEWPNLRIDFSIERADHTIFKNLTLADVTAKVDGSGLSMRGGNLEQKESQSSGVLVLLDGSGSMRGSGVDKLTAAKQGLKTLVDKLDANQRVGLIAFDEEPRLIVSPTADKEKVKQEIGNFVIRKDKSRFTRLYDAVQFGLEQAKANQVKNLLLISDGWEDTPETRRLAAAQLQSLKHDREQELTSYSRSNDIRVFTIAIGSEHGEGLSYVDRTALDNISKGANGGSAAYIELTPELGAKALQESFLLSRLQQTLNDLRQSFRYSFSLTLQIDQSAQRNTDEHKLWIGFTVGDNPRIQLPIEYTYTLPAAGVPIVRTMKVQPAIFIQSAPRTVKWQQLLFIYLVLLSSLTVLAGVPFGLKALLRGSASLRLGKAIVTVEHGSPLVGVACPNEGTAAARLYLIKEGDVVLVCPNRNCRTPHHLSCWAFNEHQCMQRNCETAMVIPAVVLEKYGLLEADLNETESWMTS